MGRDVLSVRQVMVLLTVALIAPAADILPTLAANLSGRGGWLISVGAMPVLLASLWAAAKVFCQKDLASQLGKPVGYTIIIVYMVWILLALTVALRLSGARMEVIYPTGSLFLFVLALVAVAAWMGTGKAAALARSAEIFYLAIAVVLVGVSLLAAFKIEGGNLYPPDWAAVPRGSITAAGWLLNVVPVAVLGCRIPKENRSMGRACGWVCTFCVALTLILIAVIGCIGPVLGARLEIPYLIMVQGLGVKGVLQRMEGLVASVWLLSDLVLAGGLIRSWCDYAQELHPGKWVRWSGMAAAAAALAAAWILFPEGGDARIFCIRFFPVIGLVLGLIVPAFLALISHLRGKKKRG